ncbi:MAG: methyltransferase [Lachnospiraceae bacterium]|jgi:tRNA G10  N-methylase Trm11|nr:methyltransferase [Lachnospiraceae bacterium]
MGLGLYERIKQGEDVRKHLIALKQELKGEAAREELLGALQGDYTVFGSLLSHEDPKVRKNAALVLGRLGGDGTAALLYGAYCREGTLFVKSSYLLALEGLDLASCREGLARRLEELEAYQAKDEEEKHIREEVAALRKLLPSGEGHKRHRFQGYDGTYDLLLTTGKLYPKVTAEQVKGGKAVLLKSGVRVVTSHIKPVLAIPTYRELLFFLNVRKVSGAAKEAAKALVQSNLLELLEKAHQPAGPFYFRLGVKSRMLLDQRSKFAKECAFAIEQESGRRLRNSTSGYELEIRLVEASDGMFLPFVKLFTFTEHRFAYRKCTIAASIKPEQAALAARLSRPYMKEGAQVLDPFCGVGTMLIERDRLCPAGYLYGLDIFGPAIDGAKENARLAGKGIYYIHRDFFTFQHDYLFDEIITNMPGRGQGGRGKEGQDLLYSRFFEKAGSLLKGKGKVIMYSDEKNFVKKQLRIRPEFTLLQEYAMDEKGIYHLFIIEKKEHTP